MRRLFCALPVVMCLTICGCVALEKTPFPDITAANVSIPTRLGTYGWSTRGHGIQSDAPVPDEFVSDAVPVSVPPGSTLSIHYEHTPRDLFACLWLQHKPTRVAITKGILQLPTAPGVYVYSLEATWKEGHASHVIKVAVRPE